jgi:hypothetical protein
VVNALIGYLGSGGMAERLKAAVLKTVSGVTHSGVRIPLPPPFGCLPRLALAAVIYSR